jgi:acyl carrier protein
MTKDEISAFCVDQIAEILRIPKDMVGTATKFSRLGLDSAMTVYLQIELENKLNLEIAPEMFYDHPSINALAAHLTEKVAARNA